MEKYYGLFFEEYDANIIRSNEDANITTVNRKFYTRMFVCLNKLVQFLMNKIFVKKD